MPPASNSDRLGRYIVTAYGEETVRAFVPPPLPPTPPVRLPAMQRLLAEANQSLGRLDGLASVLPNLSLFIYAYIRKEAVLSSQIEGTQSSLSDLLLFESHQAPGVPLHDVQEVSNYVAALNHGLDRLRGGFPLSLRLIREIHGVLLSKGRGSDKEPGEFRRSQNWIGGTRPENAAFVPPPPDLVPDCMNALELFLYDERTDLPLLIKAGLVHAEFETIHPFVDGNGRLGRLLITFLLCAARVLRRKIEGLGRPAASALRVFEHVQRNPIMSIPDAAVKAGISAPTMAKSVEHLQRLGILRENTGRQRRRLFVYDAYLAILNEGTEPIR